MYQSYLSNTLRHLIVVLSLLFCTFSSAQIADEILAYQDSSRLIINNGRELLVDKIADYDFEQSNKVYVYLQQVAGKKQQRAFNNSETIYINLITGNYRELLDFCKDYQQRSYLKVYAAERSLNQDLYQLFMEQLLDIKNDLEHTQLNSEEIALIKLIIYVIENDTVDDKYGTMLHAFQDENMESEYTYFIENFLPAAPIKGSFTWDVGPTYISPTGKLKEAFDARWMLGMSFDFNIKRLYTSFYINAGDFVANHPYVIKNTSLWVDDHYAYFDGGAKLGYFLYQSSRIRLAPYASVSGTTLRTNIYADEEYNNLELDLNRCLSYGAGLQCDIKLFEFTAPYYYGFYGFYGSSNTMITQYIALKFNMGYNIHSHSDYPQFEGNTFHSHIGFVWGFGIF